MSVLVDMISSAVHLFVQITRFADGKRRVTYITEIVGRDGLKILTKDIFRFHQMTVTAEGQSLGYFTGCGHVPTFQEEFKLKGLSVPLSIYKETKDTGAAAAPAGGHGAAAIPIRAAPGSPK